jgi:GDPmannose 4,6-dehydratase
MRAIVTGANGQDGAYLCDFLLKRGYHVFGGVRRTSTQNLWRLEFFNLLSNTNFHLVDLDIEDFSSCLSVVSQVQPDEVYNLAAQSFVGVSFSQPALTASVNAIGVLNMLEAVRASNSGARFYQASTSEMFGQVAAVPQSELTPFHPRSPYGVAKLYGYWITVNYRESYGMFAANGILFNHESPIRGMEFVTRKITHSVAAIKSGVIRSFELGNLDAKRDWGFAGDYVEGMWKILQSDKPDDFILATNKTTTVRSFLLQTFKAAEIDVVFENSGVDEKVVSKATGEVLVSISRKYYRPAEVDILIGCYDKAKTVLGWQPSMNLSELCELMFEADMQRIGKV